MKRYAGYDDDDDDDDDSGVDEYDASYSSLQQFYTLFVACNVSHSSRSFPGSEIVPPSAQPRKKT